MIKRIVVPVDFSETSYTAARYTVEELAPQLTPTSSSVPLTLIR